jgi:nitrile hydratase
MSGSEHDHPHEPIKMDEREASYYEKRTDALTGVCVSSKFFAFDEVRRATEDRNRLEAPYFENRLNSLIEVMVEHGRIGRDEVQARIAGLKEPELSEFEKRVIAFTDVLVAHGYTTYEAVQKIADNMYKDTPGRGARVVAKAWTDPGYKERLLSDSKGALNEVGIELNVRADPELRVLENTESVHHVVVCTLCSCYPRTLLGDPPEWYKSLAYRTRVVREPRRVLKEMGLALDPGVDIRVVDSTADVRYLVIPRRPAGTDGMSEEQLAALVTRNSMVGVAEAASPDRAPR